MEDTTTPSPPTTTQEAEGTTSIASFDGAAAPPVAKKPRIRNPYGKKSSALPPISQKPLYGLDPRSNNKTNHDHHGRFIDGTTRTSSSLSGESEEDNNSAAARLATDSIAQYDTDGSLAKVVENNAISTSPTTTTTSTARTTTSAGPCYSEPLSISLQPWQRLPTQSLSFGSAEILSISECLEHAQLYHQHGRSIRCTGIVEKIVSSLPGRVVRAAPPCLSICLSDPLAKIHNQKSGGTAMTNSDNGNDSKPSSLPLFWAVFITPEQTGVIHSTAVGSLITVIGDVIPIELSSSMRGAVASSASALQRKWALRVRLCIPVAPTTNLALQREALLLRRRHLLSTAAPANGGVLKAGCGPPPYS